MNTQLIYVIDQDSDVAFDSYEEALEYREWRYAGGNAIYTTPYDDLTKDQKEFLKYQEEIGYENFNFAS